MSAGAAKHAGAGEAEAASARARRQNISPQVISRIARELKELTKAPPEGIKHRPTDEDSLAEIHAEIEGPGESRAARAREPGTARGAPSALARRPPRASPPSVPLLVAEQSRCMHRRTRAAR